MSWRTLLGLPPTLHSFAAELVEHARRLGEPDWYYDAGERELRSHSDTGKRIHLANIFLEYSRAHRKLRPGLIGKYLSIISVGTEIPSLWTVAAKGIYPALRSRYGMMTLAIENRDKPHAPPLPDVSQAWVQDIELKLLYDFGPHMSLVSASKADTWGVPRTELWSRALSNLRALERPRWEPSSPGVLQVVSEVAYEETFLLVDEVRAALPFGADAVFAIPNRGVLIAADARDPAAVRSLIREMRERQDSNPWPLSTTLLQSGPEGWRCYEPPGELSAPAMALRKISLARTYADQKAALDKLYERTSTQVYVATVSLRMLNSNADDLHTWCTWSAGVPTLLPKTDNIALVTDPGNPKADVVLTDWAAIERVCGPHLQPTAEDPPRYRVDTFPSPAELVELSRPN
jgi:hypothetical protein